MEQSVPKRRHKKFRRRGITQKKAHNNAVLSHFSVWPRQIIGREDETREVGSVPREPKGNVLKSKRIELPPPPTDPTLPHHVILTGCYTVF